MKDLPTWFAEGQANYLGYAFSNKYFDSALQRNNTLRDLLSRFPEIKTYSISQWGQWLQKIDGDYEYTFNNSLGYSIGELLLENIYNNYGYLKVHQWLDAIRNGDTPKASFQKVFGTDYDNWLQNTAADYLKSQF